MTRPGLHRPVAHAQGYVDAFGNQVDPAVEQHHVQLHQRVLREKSADHIWQEGVGQCHRAGHPQTPARFAAHAGHGFIGGFGFQQHGLAVVQVALAHRGELQLPGGALQQACAQAFFKLGDTPRQARLGDAQLAAGSGETTGFDYAGKVEEVVEVLHGNVSLFHLWDKLTHFCRLISHW